MRQLDGHLAQCDGCRKVRENLTTAFTVWRIDVRQVTVPDAEREWHAVRRRIRGGAEAGAVRESRPRRNLFTFLAIPVGAAAAVALTFFVSPRSSTHLTPENHEGANIARARAVESGRPENLLDKIVDGAVNKYLSEVTLLGQPFVKDDKQTVEKLLKARAATVHAFHMFVLGEGIEKKKSDFVAEVMAAAGQA